MLNKWKPQWSLVFYDAPHNTREARAARRRFQRQLRKLTCIGPDGRWSEAKSGRGWSLFPAKPKRVQKTLAAILPPDAQLRIVGVTDAQIERSTIIYGQIRK